MKQIIYIIEIAVPKLVWITAISIIYILFGTNNTFSLRFCLAERETKLEHSEKFVDKSLVPKLVWITAISIIYMLFGTNNTFSLRTCFAERETKLEHSEKFVNSRTQTCLDHGIAKNLSISF